ncbi:MAG TPA: hypothetical protein VJ714_11170 [Anaerolineae bacterium]|nr:hypothetical protein [Anaerolineae bacterium]
MSAKRASLVSRLAGLYACLGMLRQGVRLVLASQESKKLMRSR